MENHGPDSAVAAPHLGGDHVGAAGVSDTPRTDAVCITPIMGDVCTEHKWMKLQALCRELERESVKLEAGAKLMCERADVYYKNAHENHDLCVRAESELARYKRLEAILRNEADVEDVPDCGDEQIVRPNAAMRLLAEWEGE